MNYQELAKELNRPVSTVRKWRADITKISGINFTTIKVKNGKGRKNRTTYDFSKEDVEKIKCFMHLVIKGKIKEQAITQIFGNEELKKQKSELDNLTLLTKLLKNQTSSIEELQKYQDIIQRKLEILTNEVSELTNRVETLENKGLKNIFKK